MNPDSVRHLSQVRLEWQWQAKALTRLLRPARPRTTFLAKTTLTTPETSSMSETYVIVVIFHAIR